MATISGVFSAPRASGWRKWRAVWARNESLSLFLLLALTGVVTIDVFNRTDNMWIGIAAGLASGLCIGLLNGFFVTVIGMESLMTTLGMMFSIRGLVYVYT